MKTWSLATATVLAATGLASLAGCDDYDYDPVYVAPGIPDGPRALDGWYYDRAVHLVWELGPDWNGESFRVYAKRLSDADYFLAAEVTNCASSVCSYTDINVVSGVTYEYFVVAVDPDTGLESEGTFAVEVFVPEPIPPLVPPFVDAFALDGAVYLVWDGSPRDASDFSHYRVYLVDVAEGGADFLLGETDSEGFLDERAQNGGSYTYRISAVDLGGHESGKTTTITSIPRPDFHGEWLWAYQDQPGSSGFRFQADETFDPLVGGTDPSRHFRLEADVLGWRIVPGPGTLIHKDAVATTALKCGPGSDASCDDLRFAPASGYVPGAQDLLPQTTYVLEVVGDDGLIHYGAVRIELLGTDQDGDAIAIFDWAYQLSPGTLQLTPRKVVEVAKLR